MTQHILSLSYGKDSIACLEACKLLGYPVNRIITAEVWATDTIPADLPSMVDFKEKADRIIKERYGLTVEHVTASKREKLSYEKDSKCNPSMQSEKLTYEKIFYRQSKKQRIIGFANKWALYCTGELKQKAFPIAPLHKERTQILCNTSALRLMNPKESSGTLAQVSFFP